MANKSLFASLKSRFARADARNEAGGRAYTLEPKHALAQLAATGCFNGTYYAEAQQQLATLTSLVDQVADNAFLAKLAVYSRQRAMMKDMPVAPGAVVTVVVGGRQLKPLQTAMVGAGIELEDGAGCTPNTTVVEASARDRHPTCPAARHGAENEVLLPHVDGCPFVGLTAFAGIDQDHVARPGLGVGLLDPYKRFTRSDFQRGGRCQAPAPQKYGGGWGAKDQQPQDGPITRFAHGSELLEHFRNVEHLLSHGFVSFATVGSSLTLT